MVKQQAIKILSVPAGWAIYRAVYCRKGSLHDNGLWLWALPCCLPLRVMPCGTTGLQPGGCLLIPAQTKYQPLAMGSRGSLDWCFYVKRMCRQHLLLGKKRGDTGQYAAILQLFSGVNTGDAITVATTKRWLLLRTVLPASFIIVGIFDHRLDAGDTLFLNNLVIVRCTMYGRWKNGR